MRNGNRIQKNEERKMGAVQLAHRRAAFLPKGRQTAGERHKALQNLREGRVRVQARRQSGFVRLRHARASRLQKSGHNAIQKILAKSKAQTVNRKEAKMKKKWLDVVFYIVIGFMAAIALLAAWRGYVVFETEIKGEYGERCME